MHLSFLPGLAAASLVLSALAPAQSRYDFNGLSGTDTHPYTPLDQQDGWSEQTFNARNRCGVTATLSYDGSPALRFQEVGPGYGCDASRINDASWSFPRFAAGEPAAYFQADMLVGYWGGSFGLGHDTNVNGQVRGAEAGEVGVRFTLGTQTNVQLRLGAADGTFVRVPLAGLGISSGQWIRVRVAMDLGAQGGSGLGYVDVRNLSAGAADFTAVPGLQAVPLNLDPTATNARNPALWDAVWLHFEGATYGLDDIEVGTGSARHEAFGSGCGTVPLALSGSSRPVVGTAAGLEVAAVPAASPICYLLLGLTALQPGFDLAPIGMPGCQLHLVVAGALVGAPAGGAASFAIPIPNDPSLAGARAHVQALAIDPAANTLGLVTSNGSSLLIGLR
jgi:hypothetical protein